MGIKYSANEEFFDRWSRPMAYVLGYLFADGSMDDSPYMRGKYVKVSSIDRQQIADVKKALQSGHTVVKLAPTTQNGKPRYLLRIGSHKLFDALTKRGMFPNKSLTVLLPAVPKKYFRDFVRGYFDGDGCVQIAKAKAEHHQFRRLRTVFTCGSKAFLEQLAVELSKLANVSEARIHDSHDAYQLSYSTSDSIRVFKYMYSDPLKGLFLGRKGATYAKYFLMHPATVDRSIKQICTSLHH